MLRVNESPSDEAFKAEFLALSLQLLSVNTGQSAALYDGSALRFVRPEPPRDPDLPLLPPKFYPRYDSALAERAILTMQVPPPLPGFIGRRGEIEQVTQVLVSGQSAVITGGADSGKTALLRQLAHEPRLRARFRRIWWLESPANAQLTLALALNAPHVLAANPDHEQPRLIREFLAQLGVLLLIDNATDADALKFCPTTVLALDAEAPITPRQGALIRLGGLDAETGAGLLGRLTGLAQEDVLPLAQVIGHHPRGLRVAAALVAEDGVTPEQLEVYLRDFPDDSLGALYRASLDALPAPYLTLLRTLALTPDQPVAVEAILSRYETRLAGQRALRWLERYAFLERDGESVKVAGGWLTLLDFAADSAPLEPYATEQATTTPAEPLTMPDIETSDTVQRSRHLHEQGLAHLEAVRDDEAEACFSEALRLRQTEKMPYATAETLVALARLAYLRGDDAAAIRRLEGAAEALHEIREVDGLAILRVALSRAYRRAGRMDAALQVLDERTPLTELAMVYRARQEWDEAGAVYQRMLDHAEAEADESGILAARLGLAETLTMAGRTAEALRMIGDVRLFAMQWLRGMVLHMQGDVRGAVAVYEQIYGDAQPEHRAALARALARAKVQLTTPETMEEDIREAAMLVGAEGIWFESRLPRPIFARQRMSHALYAHFCLMLNRREAAEAAASTALDLGGERPNAEADAIAHRVLGRVRADRGDWEGARRAFEAELKARGDLPAGRGRDDYEMGTTLHALAEALLACGELDRAVANFRRALSYKDTARDWRSFAQTQTALRDSLWQMGRKAEAIETGQHLIDLLNRQPSADLVWRGNAWAVQAQGHAETGRLSQRDAMLTAWQKCLAERIEDVLGDAPDGATDQRGLHLLAAGLLLRSKPPLPTTAPDSTPDAASVAWLVDLAEQAVVDAEREAPDTLAAWAARRDLGDLYMRLERWADAIAVLAPLLTLPAAAHPALSPIVRLAHLHTARAYIALEQPVAAAPSLEAALTYETEPQVRGAWLRDLADSFRTAGDHARAVEYDGRALEYLRVAPSITSYTETMVALAYDQYRLERYPEAIQTFKEAIKLVESQRSPDRALLGTLLFDMGTAHAALSQHKEAAATYKHALSFQDTRHTRAKYAETLIAMARSYLSTESYREALASYHEALQSDALSKPLRRTVLIEQAESFAKSRQPQAAVQAFKGALALVEPGEAGAADAEALAIHRGLAAAHTALGEHGAARAHFEAVLVAAAADSNGAELAATAWQAVGDGHVTQGQKPEAIAAYLKALAAWEAAPALTDGGRVLTIQRALGELYYETGQPTAALRHLDLALTIEKADSTQNAPRIARLLLLAADSHEQRSDPERAIHRYHEALVYLDDKAAPETVIQTLIALGRLYAGLRRWPDAITASEAALTLHLRQPSPDRARTEMLRRRLGDAYAEVGKLETAAEFYRQVAKAPTTSPERDAARESLRALEAEIARHLQTLDAAEQSWALFRKAPRPEVTELAFVRALQARTSAALGRDEESRRYAGMMLQLLKDRREDLLPNDPRPVVQALSAWLSAQEADERGDPGAAELHRQAADAIERDPKANAALKWVLAQRGRIG